MLGNGKNLMQLFWPVLLETLFGTFMGTIDTWMIASLGDKAVGAVGTANAYLELLIFMLNIVAVGVPAVMTQYVGAGRFHSAHQVRRAGLLMNGGFGLAISILILLLARPILNLLGIASELADYATVYFRIIGGACVINALIPIFSSHLRSFGYTRKPFLAALASSIVDVALNAIAVFVLHAGVMGVAVATVLARLVNLSLVMTWSLSLSRRQQSAESTPIPVILRQILKIGVPPTVENIAYNVSVTILLSFLNQMDPTGFHATARSYTLQIMNFAGCASSAFSTANCIIVGWNVAVGNFEECRRSSKKACLLGMSCALVIGGLLTLAAPAYLRFFTEDAQMQRVVRMLMLINIPTKMGLTINICYENGLKTIGDGRFPMIVGSILMIFWAGCGSWLFGMQLGWMSVGVMIAMCLDECTRGLCMVVRWRTGKWQKMALIHAD